MRLVLARTTESGEVKDWCVFFDALSAKHWEEDLPLGLYTEAYDYYQEFGLTRIRTYEESRDDECPQCGHERFWHLAYPGSGCATDTRNPHHQGHFTPDTPWSKCPCVSDNTFAARAA